MLLDREIKFLAHHHVQARIHVNVAEPIYRIQKQTKIRDSF